MLGESRWLSQVVHSNGVVWMTNYDPEFKRLLATLPVTKMYEVVNTDRTGHAWRGDRSVRQQRICWADQPQLHWQCGAELWCLQPPWHDLKAEGEANDYVGKGCMVVKSLLSP